MENQVKEQYYKAFFALIKEDLSQEPPKTTHISKLLVELVEGLCKFVPSKTQMHENIKADIVRESIDVETMPHTVLGLIKWIEVFQAPAYDTVTRQWREDLKKATDSTTFIIKFLQEYYEHMENMFKEVWEARERLVNNESVIPPEHRPVVTGSNGIPDVIRSGR